MMPVKNIEVIDFSDKDLDSLDILSLFEDYSQDEIVFIYLGKQDYKPMWKFQKAMHNEVKNNNIPNIVMYLEHSHVYTFGKNSNKDYLLSNYPENIDIVDSDRGGQVTYHGPGQLIGYPIINLNHFKKSISWYMRSIEDVIIETLKSFEITSKRKDGLTGVWVEDEKICAMGVRISKWVTMHGFALNVKPEMKYYDSMIPCGIFDYGVTSMSQILGSDISKLDLMDTVSENFINIFKGV